MIPFRRLLSLSDRVLCGLGLPETSYVTQCDFELLTLPPPPLGDKIIQACTITAAFNAGIEHKAPCILGKHSTD